VLDVGTGAGIPGIPFAVARPDIQVALLDSNSQEIGLPPTGGSDLQLKNAAVICERGRGLASR